MPIVVSLGKEYIIDNFHMNPLCVVLLLDLLCFFVMRPNVGVNWLEVVPCYTPNHIRSPW